jgi:putative endonuclease
MYYEVFLRPMPAIRREKAIKRMLRRHKIELIESRNPYWIDLATGWFDPRHPLTDDSSPSRGEAAGG